MTTEEELSDWISSWESSTLDFKDSRILKEPFKIAKLMVAFANAMGGRLVIGIQNDHTFEGLKANQETITRLVNIARNNIDPPLNINVEVVSARGGDVYVVRVPRLSLNPHAVKQDGAKMYFIRREDRIDAPSTDELRQLLSTPELVPTYVPPAVQPKTIEQTDPSASVREVANDVFVGTLLLFSFAASRPILYLFGLATVDVFDIGDVWPLLVGLGLLMLLAVYSRFSLGKDFLFAWRGVGPIVILLTIVELMTAAVAFGTSTFYPSYFQGSVLPFWQGYLAVAAESVLLALAGFVAVEVTLPGYLTHMIELDPERYRAVGSSVPQPRRFVPSSSIRRHKKVVAVVLIFALIIPGAVSGSDLGLHLFTPGVQATVVPNTLRLAFNGYYNASYLMSILTISSVAYRNSSQASNCNESYFEPFNETLLIRVPLFHAYSINNITMANPSNVSIYAPLSYESPYYYNPYPISLWQSLGIIDSYHAWISVLPKNKPAQELEIGLSNETRGSDITIGLRYFQLAHPAATCTEADHYYRRSNSTLVVHQFEIANDGPSAIGMDSVVARDFAGLNIYPGNVTITINGRPIGVSSLSYNGYPSSDYSLWDYPIMPHTFVTLVVEGASNIL
jgi:hypothetical protein